MLFTDRMTRALLAVLALAALPADATFRMSTRPIAVTRVDPLVNPKKVAGHVHDIRGASRFRGKCLPQATYSLESHQVSLLTDRHCRPARGDAQVRVHVRQHRD